MYAFSINKVLLYYKLEMAKLTKSGQLIFTYSILVKEFYIQ